MAAYQKGDYVKTFWDDGIGGTYLYGRVVQAGPRAYTVQWESDRRNSFVRGGNRCEPEPMREKPEDYRGSV